MKEKWKINVWILERLSEKIAEDKMLLPDFQRGFVWKDEEQRKIVASVLAKCR